MKAGSPAEHVVPRGGPRGERGLCLDRLSEGGQHSLPLAGRKRRRRLIVHPLPLANVPVRRSVPRLQIRVGEWGQGSKAMSRV